MEQVVTNIQEGNTTHKKKDQINAAEKPAGDLVKPTTATKHKLEALPLVKSDDMNVIKANDTTNAKTKESAINIEDVVMDDNDITDNANTVTIGRDHRNNMETNPAHKNDTRYVKLNNLSSNHINNEKYKLNSSGVGLAGGGVTYNTSSSSNTLHVLPSTLHIPGRFTQES